MSWLKLQGHLSWWSGLLLMVIFPLVAFRVGAAPACNKPDKLPYYVENNCKAVEEQGENGKISDETKLARHLVFDGYQAYRTMGRELTFNSYVNSKNAREVPNFARASIPFLRNDDYQHKRLNSAENYYGYAASTMMGIAEVASPSANDIMVESSYLALSLTSQVQCSFKLMNLFYIYQTCEGGKLAGGQEIKGKNEASCQGLYYTADGSEWIPLSSEQAQKGAGLQEGYKFKELVSNIMENDIGEVKGLQDPVTDRGRFCHELYNIGSKQRQERLKDMSDEEKLKSVPEKEEEKAMTALDNLTFFLKQYRTGYLVQATRICVLEKQGVCAASHPLCGGIGKPIFKSEYGASAGCDAWDILTWGDCQWQLMPDQVRVFPFKYADLFSNKNFCNQWDEGYPDKCDDTWKKADQYTKDGPIPSPVPTKSGKEVNHFSFVNPLTEYTDPSIHSWLMKWDSNFNTLQKDIVQKGSDKTTKAAYPKDNWTQNEDKMYYQSDKISRNAMADLIAKAKIHNIGGDIQINCAKSIINGFEPCEYEGQELEMALTKIINGTVDNNAFAEYYFGKRDHDNAVDITYEVKNYEPFVGGQTMTYRNLESKDITAKMDNPVENYSAPLPYYDACDCYDYDPIFGCYITSGTYHPGAVARYWVVIPYGQELMQTEDNILGTIYTRHQGKAGKGYLELVADDKRQSKRLAVNDLATYGGSSLPISIPGGGPISNIFTVQGSLYSKDTRVWQILQGCKDINQFFQGECGSENKPENPNRTDSLSSISNQTLKTLKEQFPQLSEEEISELASKYPDGASGRLAQYTNTANAMKEKYQDKISVSTINDLSAHYPAGADSHLNSIARLKERYGDVPGISEAVISNVVKAGRASAESVLATYSQAQANFNQLEKANVMDIVKANLSSVATINQQLQTLQALKQQYGNINETVLKEIVMANVDGAAQLVSIYQQLRDQQQQIPQSYLKDFVLAAGAYAPTLIQTYSDLRQAHSSVNPRLLKELVVINYEQAPVWSEQLTALTGQYPKLSADFLTESLTTKGYEQTSQLASLASEHINQHPQDDPKNVYTVIANAPTNKAGEQLQTYYQRVEQAVAANQASIKNGSLNEAQIKRVVAQSPVQYQNIINQYLRGELDYSSWQSWSR